MKKILLASAIAVGMASCAPTQKMDISGEWKVLTINGSQVPETMNEPTLTINASKTYSGVTGVNTMNGEYTLKDNTLTFQEAPMTKMMADPTSMEVEDSYIQAIFSTTSVSTENGRLVLKNGEGKEVMTLGKK